MRTRSCLKLDFINDINNLIVTVIQFLPRNAYIKQHGAYLKLEWWPRLHNQFNSHQLPPNNHRVTSEPELGQSLTAKLLPLALILFCEVGGNWIHLVLCHTSRTYQTNKWWLLIIHVSPNRLHFTVVFLWTARNGSSSLLPNGCRRGHQT